MFDPTDRNSFIDRIESLTGSERPLWGKMSVAQMVEHCIRYEKIIDGTIKIKRVPMGYLFGKMALNGMIGDDKPIKHSIPTLKELVVKETSGNFELQKQKWIELVRGFEHFVAPTFIHPFFGKMTKEQTGRLAYKHTDHHLRQFGR